MKWFKHYYNASYSVSLSELIDEVGVSGYGHYWLLLELLAEKYDGESTTFIMHFEEISRKVRIKFRKKLETFIQKLPESCITFEEIRPKVYKIEAPIMLELQGRDFKKARSKSGNTAPKNKSKDIDIDIDIEKNKTKKLNPYTQKILDFWNAKNIKAHKNSDSNLEKISKQLDKKIKTTPIEEIMQAVENYAMTVNSEATYFTFKWPLWIFLSRDNASQFYPGEFEFNNYLSKTANAQRVSREQQKQDSMLKVLEGFENENRASNS
jgi:hypothetical protein